MSTSVFRVCFVCLGNIIRSPLAEHLFRHYVNLAGLNHKYQIASAGTGTWHIGEPPDARMRRVAERHGLHYTGRARQIHREDLKGYDLIVAMDMENRADLYRMASSSEQKERICLLREFDPFGGVKVGVPDPFYDKLDGFEETYNIIDRSVQGLLEALEKGTYKSRSVQSE